MNLGRNRRSLSARRDVHRDLSLDKIKCQRLHPVVLALRPAILNDNVAAIEIADCKPRRKPAMRWVKGPADVVLRKPITGIAGCCALASIGNATDAARWRREAQQTAEKAGDPTLLERMKTAEARVATGTRSVPVFASASRGTPSKPPAAQRGRGTSR